MRLWLFLPLTYLAGVHGFALFAPYLIAVLFATQAMQPLLRRPARQLVPAA